MCSSFTIYCNENWEHILGKIGISFKRSIVHTDLQHCLNFLLPERSNNSELSCTLGKKLVQEQEYRILLIMPENFILVPCFCSLEIASFTHTLTNKQLKYFLQDNFCSWHTKKTSLYKGFCNMPFAPTD